MSMSNAQGSDKGKLERKLYYRIPVLLLRASPRLSAIMLLILLTWIFFAQRREGRREIKLYMT
jgi:hypothetical protein